MRGECTLSPTSRRLLRETPDDDSAEASRTARILVVLLDSFLTACMGSRTLPSPISPGHHQEQAQHGQD